MRLIDADALIGQYNKFALTAQTDYAEGVRDVVNDINNAPTIEAVPKDFHDKTCEAMAKRHQEEIQKMMPKRGKWIDFKSGWKCNACGKWNSEKSNFCPNCGADMRGKDDEVR